MKPNNVTTIPLPTTPTEWISAVVQSGFRTKSVEEVQSLEDLNNFVMHWPDKMYRRQAMSDPAANFYERTNLELQLHFADGLGLVDTVQQLRLYSRRYLEESPKKFYNTLDLVIARHGLLNAGTELCELVSSHFGTGIIPDEKRQMFDALLATYREMRELGYSHFELAG